MLGHSIKENTVGLSIFAVVTGGIIAFTQISTTDKIDTNIALAKTSTLHQIISEDSHDNDLVTDVILISDRAVIADDGPTEAYVARKDGKAVAIIMPAVTNNGYTGRISSLVGINADGTIAKVRVLTHQETPGLGDKVEVKKSGWVHQFESKSLGNPDATRWAVKKDNGDFDQLTGATITPRAVVNSVLASLQYFEANRERLLAPKEQAATKQTLPTASDDANSTSGQTESKAGQ